MWVLLENIGATKIYWKDRNNHNYIWKKKKKEETECVGWVPPLQTNVGVLNTTANLEYCYLAECFCHLSSFWK